MFKSIPGNHEFLISKDGEFKSRFLSPSGLGCTPSIQSDKVRIGFFGEERELSVKWLALISHYETFLPDDHESFYENIYFVGDQMVFSKPLRYRDHFRVVPGYVRYAVKNDGTVVDIGRDVELKHHVPLDTPENKKRYTTVTCYDPRRRSFAETGLHRLVALAWVHNPEPETKVFVNHKDGNKRNPYFKNLEWVTAQENNVHAVKTGLRKDNVPCKIRDISTGEVTIYQSFGEASNAIKIDTKEIIAALGNVRRNKALRDRFEVKRLDDDSPWSHENGIVKAGRYITTVVAPDGTVETFNDTRDIVTRFKLWNIPSRGIRCIQENMDRLYPGYKVTVVDQYDTRPIQALKVDERKVMETKTIREMSKLTGMDHRYIRRYLISPKLYAVDGYAYRYKTDESWPERIEPLPSKSVCILATQTDTGKEIEFKSLRAAADHFGVDRSVIKKRIEKKVEYQGWKFQELET